MPVHYAVVAYVRDQLGHFVEDLRRELYPEHAHLAAHITVLPPRLLSGTEEDAVSIVRAKSERFEPFSLQLAEVASFMPKTPTVFIRVERAGYKFRELHDAMCAGAFQCVEQFPYMPHLTIVKMPQLADAERALETARARWAAYTGPRQVDIDSITFVREGAENRWLDIATVPLGIRDKAAHR
jgi:2'-5' RNA ligase